MCFLSAGIKGVHRHTQLWELFYLLVFWRCHTHTHTHRPLEMGVRCVVHRVFSKLRIELCVGCTPVNLIPERLMVEAGEFMSSQLAWTRENKRRGWERSIAESACLASTQGRRPRFQ